jgi:chromosome segregation ATPase
MNRTLTWLNLSGVMALAVLCGFQWRSNRTLNLDVNALQKTGMTQAARLVEQDHALAGLAADLERFRGEIGRAHAELRDTSNRLQVSEQSASKLGAERDQLKTSIARWTAAVEARDQRIAEANERIREVGGRLKDAVEKFNELATRYNERVEQLNQLTSRYNTVVEQLNQSRGGGPQSGEKADNPSKRS